MHTIWKLLEIEKTTDRSIIRRAYGKLILKYNPEDYPEEFLAIRSAYETAMNYAASADLAGTNKRSGEQEEDGRASNPADEEDQEDEGPKFFSEKKQMAVEAVWTFDPEELDEANAFRDGEAIKAFHALYLGKSRADKTIWIKYFSSDLFLDVFRAEGFTKLMWQTVDENRADYPPHKNFLLALSLTYTLAKPKDEGADISFRQSSANFAGISSIHSIAAEGPQFQKVKGTDLAILYGYQDYFSLLHLTERGEWDDEISSQFSDLLRRYTSGCIKEKAEQESSDPLMRHPSCLNLLAHMLSTASLPAQAYSLTWQRLPLRTATMGRDKLLYGRLREIVLDHCPELAQEESISFLQLRKDYTAYSRRSILRKGSDEETEKRETDQFLAAEIIKHAFADPIFVEYDILRYWICDFASTYFMEKIVSIIKDDPTIPYGDALLKKAKQVLKQQVIKKKWQEDENGQLPESCVDVSSRAYFRYLLNVSFHQAYHYQRSISLSGYLAEQFPYAEDYAKSLLSFDESSEKCMEERKVTLSLSENDQLEIAFHLYYVSYTRNQVPIYAPFINFDLIADRSDHDLFWLLLPLTFAHVTQENEVLQKIHRRLVDLGFLEEDSCKVIAESLTMMICTSDAEEFYPDQLVIYEESKKHLYFSKVFLNEGVLLVAKMQVNKEPEVLRNESYPVDDVNAAITLSHRLLSEYTHPFDLNNLRIDDLPDVVYHGFNHRQQQCLDNEAVTYDTIKALLAQFLAGQLERLELCWESPNVGAGRHPARSLVLLKAFSLAENSPEYACFSFDHLGQNTFALLSHPELYEGYRVRAKYTAFSAGQIEIYNVHQNTERIAQFLNKAIAQSSDLSRKLPHDKEMWSLNSYYNGKEMYDLDLYLLGGYSCNYVEKKLARSFILSHHPRYMEARDIDGKATAYDMKLKDSFVIKQQLQKFLSGDLTKLRLTWSWNKNESGEMQTDEGRKVSAGKNDTEIFHTHLLLLSEKGKSMLIYLDDYHRQLYQLICDQEAQTGDNRREEVMFHGIGHAPDVLHGNMEKIRESLSLLLPGISYPDGILRVYGQYAHCSEMKIGKTVRNYEELKSLYIEG